MRTITSKLARSRETKRPSSFAILMATLITSTFSMAYLSTSHCYKKVEANKWKFSMLQFARVVLQRVKIKSFS